MVAVFTLVLALFLHNLEANHFRDVIYVSVKDYWQWRHCNDFNEKVHIYSEGGYPPSWTEAQHHCQQRLGTDLASPDNKTHFQPILSKLSANGHIHIGLRQKVYLEPNIEDSDWIRVDGSQCPLPVIEDKNGHKLCSGDIPWRTYRNSILVQPDNFFNVEHCVEMNKEGTLNDIICPDVSYSWIEGFVCNKPNNYNDTKLCDIYYDTNDETNPDQKHITNIYGFPLFVLGFLIILIILLILIASVFCICYNIKRPTSGEYGNEESRSDTTSTEVGSYTADGSQVITEMITIDIHALDNE